MTDADSTPIHRLLDAIELVQANRKAEAVPILRGLIAENNNLEEAWLWMSVAVESMDQSLICLDNVLRINPHNETALRARLRLREIELASERKRGQLRSYRDMAFTLFWVLVIGIIFAIFQTYCNVVTLFGPTAS
jgi:hypothetical protein